jgi:hypothetical protein
LIVVASGVCVLRLAGWRRTLEWVAATAIPTAMLYLGFAALRGVRSPSGFWRWSTGYLHSQHALQVRFPDSLVKSVMGIVSAFVNQDPFKDAVVEAWSPAAILWFYGAAGVCLAAAAAVLVVRARRPAVTPNAPRSLRWICVATIASWSVFCLLWEPTNYYWYVLLPPLFVWVAAALGPARRSDTALVAALCAVSAWNLYANHVADAAGTRRAPGPQMAVLERNLMPHDLLWVVDLGWYADVDYDLLATTSSFEHGGIIRSVSDLVGRSPDATAWQAAFQDSTTSTLRRGGRVFVSGRVFDEDVYERSWEASPFSDYEVERRFPIDWPRLGRELPAFVDRRFDIVPAGFSVGSDSIFRIVPLGR